MALNIPRQTYTDIYGPTVGDKVRLADTGLFIEVEKDHTVYGDESKFGGGKNATRWYGTDARYYRSGRCPRSGLDECLDSGLLGNRQGGYWGGATARSSGLGSPGIPNIMEGVSEGMVVGAGTEVSCR